MNITLICVYMLLYSIGKNNYVSIKYIINNIINIVIFKVDNIQFNIYIYIYIYIYVYTYDNIIL